MRASFRGHFKCLRKRLSAWFLLAACILFLTAGSTHLTFAQVPTLSPDQLQRLSPDQLQRLQAQTQTSGTDAAVPPQPTILTPPAASVGADTLPVSRLEQIISTRAGMALKQFGYNQLGRASSVELPQTGAIPDSYVLGVGDEIVVSLRGQENNEVRATIDRNGQVTLPRLRPLPAAGRTFGSFRTDLQDAVHRAYVATDVFASISRLRMVSVMVAGEVNNPGLRQVTGLSSAIDAILLSGGVKKTGSLRNIRVIRDGREYSIDLYSVIADQASGTSTMRLADGDRILVPPLGPTVAITGLVRRPGIFELAPKQSSMSATALLALAGGEEVRGKFQLSVMRLMPDGRFQFAPLTDRSTQIRDSEILFVQLGVDETVSQATLSGGTGLAGRYPIVNGTKLSEVLKAPGSMGITPYMLIGLVSRRDPRTLMRQLVAFTPVAVLNGGEDMPLQSDDIVRVFTTDEFQLLVQTQRDFAARQHREAEILRNPLAAADANSSTNSALAAGAAARVGPKDGVVAVDSVAPASDDGRALATQQEAARSISNRPLAQSTSPSGTQPAANFQTDVRSGLYVTNREVATFSQLAQQLLIDPLVLVNFLTDHQVSIGGAVSGSGSYFVGPSATVQDLLAAAGGMSNWADQSNVELITTIVDPLSGHSQTQRTTAPLAGPLMAKYIVKPHDQIRFNKVFNDVDIGEVVVQGEVRFSGNYTLTRGEHLSDLLTRAGGLTNEAYPYGAVFLRKSAAALEKDSYFRAAKEVEDQLIVAMTRIGTNRLDPAVFSSMQAFVTDLRNQTPLGRISVIADPSVLASQPALDPLLEPGDVVFIPPRPSTVTVLGQVMQPGGQSYRAGMSVADYIAEAGGVTSLADSSEIFVVLPNGAARKLERSWLHLTNTASLAPGSTIFVPRDVTPLDLRQTIIDVTQIVSQLAVSIASVAVISKQ